MCTRLLQTYLFLDPTREVLEIRTTASRYRFQSPFENCTISATPNRNACFGCTTRDRLVAFSFQNGRNGQQERM